MRRRWLAVGLLVLGCGLSVAVPSEAHEAETRRVVLGYYVPYDATSWTSLEQHADALDMVAPQWVSIDPCGNLGSRDDQTLKELANKHNIKVVPSLFTLSGWLNHQLLADDETSAHVIEQIVNYVLAENYDGFDVDLEAVDPDDRTALTRFVQWLSAALHDQGKLLTLAIPAKERDVTVGWAGAYDYAALGAQADLITVMAYEYRGPFSGPGSVAPYAWVRRVAAFASAQIPPDRVLLGLAFYGYDWNTTSGGTRALGYPQAVALAEHYGADMAFQPDQQSVTFGYEAPAGESLPWSSSPPVQQSAHKISVRTAPPCDISPPPPSPLPTPTPAPLPGLPQTHAVWIEDGASAAARLNLANVYQIGGVAAWRLGLEDPNVWPLLDEWRRHGS